MGGVKVPVDFSSGAVWTFWFGIFVALLGVGIAIAGYVSDQQTRAEIARVQSDATTRIAEAEARAQAKISEVERSTAERRLTPQQHAAFVALFRTPHRRLRVSYIVGQGAGDVSALISDILTSARDAGAEIGASGMALNPTAPGIGFDIPKDDPETLERLQIFARSLGITVNYTANQQTPQVFLTIGSRAPGFP